MNKVIKELASLSNTVYKYVLVAVVTVGSAVAIGLLLGSAHNMMVG